jgi:hypothetical protein
MKFIQKLGSFQSITLYIALIVVSTIALFPKIEIPNEPDQQTVDLFVALMQIPEDKPILIQSDWTNSSRGESAGSFEALMRLLMRKNVKFVLYSVGDPQAPQVARDVIARVNAERVKENDPRYVNGVNYAEAGYFPNAEGVGVAMASDVRKALTGRRVRLPDGNEVDLWKLGFLSNAKKVEDFGMLINVTASGTIDVIVERLGGKIPLTLMCTGVMGPQAVPYYASKQLKGLSIGLKGVYEMESMMQYGVRGANVPATGKDDRRIVSKNNKAVDIKGFEGKTNFARGNSYYLALHVALFLLIGCVLLGNLELIANRILGRNK